MKDLDISILVNNAGVLYNGFFRDLTVKQVTEQVVVNTYPYVLLTKALIPRLKGRGLRSAIVTVSSSISIMPAPYQMTYCCTKKFERDWAEALRVEMLKECPNVEVYTLCPMYVQT